MLEKMRPAGRADSAICSNPHNAIRPAELPRAYPRAYGSHLEPHHLSDERRGEPRLRCAPVHAQKSRTFTTSNRPRLCRRRFTGRRAAAHSAQIHSSPSATQHASPDHNRILIVPSTKAGPGSKPHHASGPNHAPRQLPGSPTPRPAAAGATIRGPLPAPTERELSKIAALVLQHHAPAQAEAPAALLVQPGGFHAWDPRLNRAGRQESPTRGTRPRRSQARSHFWTGKEGRRRWENRGGMAHSNCRIQDPRPGEAIQTPARTIGKRLSLSTPFHPAAILGPTGLPFIL